MAAELPEAGMVALCIGIGCAEMLKPLLSFLEGSPARGPVLDAAVLFVVFTVVMAYLAGLVLLYLIVTPAAFRQFLLLVYALLHFVMSSLFPAAGGCPAIPTGRGEETMMRERYMDVRPPVDHLAARSSWFPAVARGWTAEENKRFESELAGIDLCRPDWEKVARAIPGRTVREVVSHFKNLQVDVQQMESGLVPMPVYGGGAGSFTLQWGGNGGYGPEDFRHGLRFGGGCGKATTPEQERKKGVPWTEEEHKLFLLGLKKYGKGDWRNISRDFVQTRTPTQVASHAQKYFIRLNSGGKDKRRSSIHDITTVNLTDEQPPSPSQSSLITNQSNASAATAGISQFSLAADTVLEICPSIHQAGPL